VIGKHKRFDPGLFAANDAICKHRATALLLTLGYEVKLPKNSRTVDLEVFSSGELNFHLECEKKNVWTTPDFKYDSVQFPERKLKYVTKFPRMVFLMFNADLTAWLSITGASLAASPLKEVYNKFSGSGEMFFQVPLIEVDFNNLSATIRKL
jgi:hypothetical protein